MRISLIKNSKIKNFILPNRIYGNFWLTDFDRNGIEHNLINIEASDNEWKLISNDEVFCFSKDQKLPYFSLREYQFYAIKDDINNNVMIIYCSPISDPTISYLNVTTILNTPTGLTIGQDVSNSIVYNSPYLEKLHAKILKEQDGFTIQDIGSKYGVYINNERVVNSSRLEFGDVIFIMGLKIVFMQINESLVLIVNNPNNLVSSNLEKISSLPDNSTSFTEPDEENDMLLYDQDDYFHKKPRFIYSIKELNLGIDAPPAKENDKENSTLLTVGPMLTMSMTSMVTGYTAVNSVLNNGATWSSAMPSLVLGGAMLGTTFIWPLFSRSYEKRRKKHAEKIRQRKYGEYIEKQRQKIAEEVIDQKNILMNSFPRLDECQNIILNKQTNLWERRIEDADFLTVNLGYGTIPMKINIKYPEEHFSIAEDNLKEMVNSLGSEPKKLVDVPVVYSFIENYISAIIGKENLNSSFIKNILLQLMTFHSYDDIKIVLFTDENKESNWDYLKALPHLWSDDKTVRYFASSNDEYKELCYNLDRVFTSRKEAAGSNVPKPNSYDPLYLVITDSFRSIRNFDFIKNILESKTNYGFSMVILNQQITSLPDQCQTFIKIDEKEGELFKNISSNERQYFYPDLTTKVDIDRCVKTLANIPIEFNNNSDGKIPNKVGFLEMYDVGKVEQLNSLNRWEKQTPILNMQAPVGIGKSGEKISLDLHEKYHGPHGLIAGMTGSGKSEFIITYILSMAVNYHPYEVQFILIDYKGGGLAGAFENTALGLKLPHLVGTITNLDTNEMKRSLASVESELKRRQKAFNKAREKSGESTVDIYKYQRMYRDHVVDEPVSHLFIITDEFAELKNQQPEFMEQLISTARIGRSLGVHLILATQKPSGVVDPQIWSNTRFRVCLRVQEKSDSVEVIKSPDAALLKQTGRFYLQVGFNEVFVLGQSAWAGGKYIPSEKIKKTIDSSLLFIDNIGNTIKNVESKKKVVNVESKGEELSNVLRYLCEIAKQDNIKCKPLWLEKIPDYIAIEDLSKKYNYQKESFIINPIIGEYDVPDMQEQHLLTIPISSEGNTMLYGASGSGKENFITTMIYSSMLYYTPEEVNYYVLDFGAEVLKCFTNSPLVGDIIYIDDNEKLKNLFKMITSTINERKKLFANYNGDFINYCKNSGSTVPSIIVIINNYEAYQETFPTYDEELTIITRDCSKYGVYFVIACNTPNGARFKLKQNFPQTFVLQQNSEDDYTTILGNVHKNYPSKLFGRGIFKREGLHEFQTAFVTARDDIPNMVKAKSNELCQKYNSRAKNIPTLPLEVTYQSVASEFGKTDELIIGIDKENLQITKYDFKKNFITLITSIDLSIISNFLSQLLNQFIAIGKSPIIVIDTEEYNLSNGIKSNIQHVCTDFNTIFSQLEKFVNDNNDLYKNSNYNKTIFENIKPITCIIIGVDAFKNKLNDANKLNFGAVFDKSKDLEIINFIFVDSIDKIKKIELESWYRNNVNANEGIWLGNGINDQFSLKISQKIPEMREELPINFCFVIKKGKPILVKYIEKFDYVEKL